MKKTYQKPVTLLGDLDLQQLLTSSLKSDENGIYQDLGDAPTTDATSGNLSRRSVWNDEDTFDEEGF
jgi:hypothetical protein